ncbi:uncharacterized protein [Diabrotica undecimpunctata]|uniref:uncharacterized protein n=1 Tax=Diabrotica undecimpunctata TaxID=50387 RepID=UPI003B63F6CE
MVDERMLEDEFEVRNKFDNEIYDQVSIAKEFLSKHKDDHDSSHSNQSLNVEAANTGVALNNVRLPTINLPKFDGSYPNWLEFRDIFRSLIYENDLVSDVQKLHYLRASLEGDACLVIKCLEISSANYIVAWNALLDRYDNNNLLIHNHVKALFSSESVSKESASGLRKLIDDFSKNIRSLHQ